MGCQRRSTLSTSPRYQFITFNYLFLTARLDEQFHSSSTVLERPKSKWYCLHAGKYQQMQSGFRAHISIVQYYNTDGTFCSSTRLTNRRRCSSILLNLPGFAQEDNTLSEYVPFSPEYTHEVFDLRFNSLFVGFMDPHQQRNRHPEFHSPQRPSPRRRSSALERRRRRTGRNLAKVQYLVPVYG